MAVISGQAGFDPTDLTRPALPCIYAAQLVQLVARWNIAPGLLLEGTGIEPATLEDLNARLTPYAMGVLVSRALCFTREPGLGYYFGLHLKVSTHGSVGLLAMTSPTLRDAIAVGERYVSLRTPHVTFKHYVERDQAVIEIIDAVPVNELRIFLAETLFTALVQVARSILGRAVQAMFEMAFPEPRYFQGFAHLLPGPVRFRQPVNRILFPASMLDEALHMADPITAKQVSRECEEELASLDEASSLLAKLRRRMLQRRDVFPSLEEVATERHVSPRTLKRQLAAHGTSYRQLLDEVRRDRAIALLDDPRCSVEQIAEALGYSDASNFNRAFRRWLGVSPSAFRERHVRSK